MHQYCGRITDTLDNWDNIQKLFKDFKISITGACYETGKRKENPHYHLLFSHSNKDSYLRKNFFSKHFPKKYSIKYLDENKLTDMQQYMSKTEHSGDQILLANWDTTKANKQYWIQNDKLLNKCNTITDKLLYHFQHKYVSKLTDDFYHKIQSEQYTGTIVKKQDIDLYYSCVEYFRDNGKLVPLDHDMKKYIRTLNLRLCPDDKYLDQIVFDFFKNY